MENEEIKKKLQEHDQRLLCVENKANLTETNLNNLTQVTEKNFANYKEFVEKSDNLLLAQIETLIVKENKKLKDDYDDDRLNAYEDNKKALRNAVISIIVALTITVITIVLNLK